MEQEALASSSDLSNHPWQSEKKVLIFQAIDSGVRMDDNLDPLQEGQIGGLLQVVGLLHDDWHHCSKGEKNVIRESKTKARSRHACLTAIEWVEKSEQWKLLAMFCHEM